MLLGVIFISLTAFCQALDNEVYFRIGYSNPSWNYFEVGKDGWGDGVSKYGANFELGSIFLIKAIIPSEKVALGINIDYIYGNFNNFKFGHGRDQSNLGVFKVGSKIGPSFTYSPAPKMAIDVFFKADLAWAALAVPYTEKIDDGDDYYIGYTPLGWSTGLNFRHGVLMLGFEFNTTKVALESDDKEGVFLQEEIGQLYQESDGGKKSKLPNMNFTIGLSF